MLRPPIPGPDRYSQCILVMLLRPTHYLDHFLSVQRVVLLVKLHQKKHCLKFKPCERKSYLPWLS